MESVLEDTDIIDVNELIREQQKEYALKRIYELPEEYLIEMFSNWAAENRYIPEGISDYPGPYDKEFAPHWNEILDRCHPSDDVRIISVIKSVQAMFTTSVIENAIGSFIANKLGSILSLTSTKTIAAIRGSAHIDTLIDNSDLAKYIIPMSNRNKRKTKDNALYKELAGNSILMITSYNSIGDLKSNKFNFIIEDELDEAPGEIKGLGDVEKVIEGRTYGTAFYKILQGSTSSAAATSRIYKNYMLGDRRHYFVPCPICKREQELDLRKEGEKHGLTFSTELDKETGEKQIEKGSVRYVCKYCNGEFYESDKNWLLNNGVWIPQAKSSNPLRTSYKAPGFLSPALPWERICQAFIDTKFGKDIPTFKDFCIDMLAKPWFGVQKAADWEMLKERAEDYTMGEVPKGQIVEISGQTVYLGPLLPFGGVDVQKDRLELCVTAFGFNGEKWIIDYKIFYGNTENIDDPCWIALSDYGYQKMYKICGQDIPIQCISVDSGYDPRKTNKREKDYNGKAHIVYEFVSNRTEKFIAIMGNPDIKAIGILKESRINDVNTTLTKRYMVSVSTLKESIMGVIENKIGYNTIHVPSKEIFEGEEHLIPDEWYKQFLSERLQADEKDPKKMVWTKTRARNEVLDTFIYSIAAAHYYNVHSWSMVQWSIYYQELTEAFNDDS